MILVLKIDDIVIDKVEECKVSGCKVNSALTWLDHINIIYDKVIKSIAIVTSKEKC